MPILWMILLATGLSCAARDPGARGIPRFERVDETLYRGGQPDLDAMRRLADRGVRTVITLRGSDGQVAREEAAAIAAGLRHIQVPLDPRGRPDDASIRRLIDLLTDETNQPVFLHCRRGADRTGTVVACYRIAREGWSAERALEEADSLGLGWWQRGMRAYIEDACGEAIATTLR